MLSYDTPVSVNGQAPGTPTTIPTAMQTTASMPLSVTNNEKSSMLTNGEKRTKYHHIWLVTGPAGCGKSTIAEHIANALNFPYIEGDQFHPKANIDKMSRGIPLADADRWDWLTALRKESMRQLASGSDGVVLTCSALKRKYRDVIRVAGYYDHSLLLHFIYLDASESLLLQRVAARQNHYMKPDMVQSQFKDLEPPEEDEKDVIRVDVARTVDEVKLDALQQVLAEMNAH